MKEQEEYMIQFPSRLSFRAVTAGISTVFALMALLMTFGAAVGGWALNMDELPRLPIGFWFLSAAAWVFSVYFGARLAVAASRSSGARDGVLQGITVWAGSCVAACVLLTLGTGRMFNYSSGPSTAPFWAAFLGNGCALLFAVWAGWLGSQSELKAARQERWRHEAYQDTRIGKTA